MASGNWAIVATLDVARLKRSYERNLGHARFLTGVFCKGGFFLPQDFLLSLVR